MDIKGIGSKLEKSLKDQGITTIKQLMKKEIFNTLPIVSQLWLKYKPETKIPRKIIEELEPKLSNHAIIAGSFLRGKSSSSDIDIVFLPDKNYTIKDYLKNLPHIIISEGDDKVSILYKYKTKYIQIDIFITNKKEYYAMLLYVTGSKTFNMIMRGIAKKQGYLLNQKGLFKGNKQYNFDSEEGYFKKLGMKYKTPKERDI